MSICEANACAAAPPATKSYWERGSRGVTGSARILTIPDTVNGPVERIEGDLAAGILFLCDHAANALPDGCETLGLTRPELDRHIAYDIGAAWITRRLATLFHAPAVLSRFSRLLIDPNRGADDPTLVMRIADGTVIPGNAGIDASEIEFRRLHYWQPYRNAVSLMIEAMLKKGPPPAIVSTHTFTPVWRGQRRLWETAVLWDSDPRFAKPLIEAMTKDGLIAGDNEPYDGALAGDTLNEEVTRRGLAGLLIEMRNDLVNTEAAANAWAGRLAKILRPVLARPEIHVIKFFPSRTGRNGSQATETGLPELECGDCAAQ
jgi:predicted N-formylglutamate amidohydrolase